MADCLLVLVPFVSRYLIQFVIDSYIAHLREETGPPVAHGIGYLAAMVVMLAIQSFAHNHYMYLMAVMGGRTRAILTSSLFEKSANVRGLANSNPAAEKQKTKAAPDRDGYHLSGHITNLVTVHCGRIDKTISAIHMLWTAPLSLGLAIALCEFRVSSKELIRLLTWNSNIQSSRKCTRRPRITTPWLCGAHLRSQNTLRPTQTHRQHLQGESLTTPRGADWHPPVQVVRMGSWYGCTNRRHPETRDS
jgi:hypothetical protein